MANNKFKLIDILGILSYLLMAGSCFLPFLNYKTLTSVETITYFQGNGKLIFGFSLLAILFLILKFFKYTFMCLGLTIGVLIYDVTFGLLEVVREKTTVYGLRYGFYLIATGMIINLIYIIVRILIITKEYNKQYESDNHDSKNNSSIEILDIEEFGDIPNQSLSEEKKDFIEPIDVQEMIAIETEKNKEETDEKVNTLSIFNDFPDIDMVNTELKAKERENDVQKTSYSSEPPSLYKLCDNCGMQISYSDDICPVCGKQF